MSSHFNVYIAVIRTLILTLILQLHMLSSELKSKIAEYEAVILDLTHDRSTAGDAYRELAAKMDGMAPAPL